MKKMAIALLTGLLATATLPAQDVPTGPDAGKPVPALKVFDATGPNMGKEVDYAEDRKKKPTVYALVNAEKFDRPMAGLLRKLDELITEQGGDTSVVVVWVTGDLDKAKDYLPKLHQILNMASTVLTASPDGENGPEKWNVNLEAHLTTVVAHEGKVVKVFGYRSFNEDDAKAMVKALAEAKAEK